MCLWHIWFGEKNYTALGMFLKPLVLAMTLQLNEGNIGGIECLQPPTFI